jgi:hypothetical protein
MLKVTTTNSVYLIDLDAKTWERISHMPSTVPGVRDDAPLRTEHGVFVEIMSCTIGKGLLMICPPINPPYHRVIWTSDITAIEITN